MKSFTIILALSFIPVTSLAQTHLLQASVVSAGGGSSASTSYKMIQTVGQPVGGMTISSANHNDLGFWYLQDALKKFYSASYSLSEGWNLVSIPRTVPDYRKSALFPTATTTAFAYTGSYKPRDTLANGTGYWVKFPIAQQRTYNGTPRITDTLEVKSNWNIIGSIAQAVPVNSITQDPPNIVMSQYFAYGNGYHSSSEIEPGKAYWVKTSAAGKLILNTPSAQSPGAIDAKHVEISDELNSLTVSRPDHKGIQTDAQPLLFGAGKLDKQDMTQFEMPPAGPAGSLDVRFGSNRFVELVPENLAEPQEIPISIETGGGPFTLTWKMKERAGMRYKLLEKKGERIISHQLTANGSVTVEPEEGKSFVLRVESVPTKYTLYQNYPNPWNPTTTIRYDLPEASSVTITIFNILGQEVHAPLNAQQVEEGAQSIFVDGRSYASGTYFYRIDATGLASGKIFHEVKKMLLIK